MAELELAIKYKSVPARVGLATMGLMMPVWALFIPFLLGQFIQLVLRNPQLNPWMCMVIICGLLAVPLISIVAAAFCEDDRLLVSKEGLAFPLMFLPGLAFRRERLWSDLRHIGAHWSSTVKFEARDCLTLYFRSGGSVRLGLNQICRTDLEQLLLAIEVWGSGCQRPTELVDFQNTLANENKGITNLSYTQMWEEELRRRFSSTAFVPLEPGHLLAGGRLNIVRQLAFGGLSAIYVAQRDNHELVVVKEAVVPANADERSREKANELFAREAQLLMKLQHPQIARVFDRFQEDGRNYLVLEYVNGPDLRQLVRQNGPQSEETTLGWAEQITGIMEFLHEQKPPIIHRDLTPDNLVLRDDGTLTLIDFGAANEFVGTATGTLVGKQSYISPEQFRGKAVTQSDIYSFGCTLYFLLTGQDPEALSVSSPRDRRDDISEELNNLVMSATAMEAADRPASAKELKSALTAIRSRGAAAVAAPAGS